jgi:hypothetical protein
MVSNLTVTPDNFRVSDVVQTDFKVTYEAHEEAGHVASCVVSIRVKRQVPFLGNGLHSQITKKKTFTAFTDYDK